MLSKKETIEDSLDFFNVILSVKSTCQICSNLQRLGLLRFSKLCTFPVLTYKNIHHNVGNGGKKAVRNQNNIIYSYVCDMAGRKPRKAYITYMHCKIKSTLILMAIASYADRQLSGNTQAIVLYVFSQFSGSPQVLF